MARWCKRRVTSRSPSAIRVRETCTLPLARFISDSLLKGGSEGEEESLPLVTLISNPEEALAVCLSGDLFVELVRDEPDK